MLIQISYDRYVALLDTGFHETAVEEIGHKNVFMFKTPQKNVPDRVIKLWRVCMVCELICEFLTTVPDCSE